MQRLWLGWGLFIAVCLARFLPGFSLCLGVVLAAIILLHLYYVPLSQTLGNFLRVSPEHPILRRLKLTGFGVIAALLIGLSATEYWTRHTDAKIALQKAADEAARSYAVAGANAQVSRLVENAKAALATGDMDKAEQTLAEAAKVSLAQNRGLVEKFKKRIKDSADPALALNALGRLSDADFAAFKAGTALPQSLSLDYAALTNRFVATAKSQLDTAAVKRAEIKKIADEKAAAEQAAAKAEASKKSTSRSFTSAEDARYQTAKKEAEVKIGFLLVASQLSGDIDFYVERAGPGNRSFDISVSVALRIKSSDGATLYKSGMADVYDTVRKVWISELYTRGFKNPDIVIAWDGR